MNVNRLCKNAPHCRGWRSYSAALLLREYKDSCSPQPGYSIPGPRKTTTRLLLWLRETEPFSITVSILIPHCSTEAEQRTGLTHLNQDGKHTASGEVGPGSSYTQIGNAANAKVPNTVPTESGICRSSLKNCKAYAGLAPWLLASGDTVFKGS